MMLSLEKSEKDIIRPLDDGEKKLLSAYGDLDAAKCYNEDPLSLDNKMLQLAVVQSKELGNHDRVLEVQSLHSSSPHVDGGVEIPHFTAYLGSFSPVGTAIRSVWFLDTTGSSRFSFVSQLKEPTPEEIRVKSNGKFCWFFHLGMLDGACKLINE